MPVDAFKKTRIAPDAKSYVDRTLAKVAAPDQAKVKQALADLAAENGDRYLNSTEAKAAADVFEAAAPAGSLLAGAALDSALSQVGVKARDLARAADVDGVTAAFSFQTSLEKRLIAELNGAVERAAGRKLDVNVLIFEFQSDEIEKAIVDIARSNPNVTFRVVADSTQATPSGGNALPSILKEKLPNVQVKFKKDFPYLWSSEKQRPVYNHGATQGLNHHKGFATLIDGAPDRLVTGSFNWSDTADEKNYEDLVVFRPQDSSSRRAIEQYTDEFAGYFNSDEATLSPNNFSNFKREMWDEMVKRNGGTPPRTQPLPDDSYPDYVPAADARSFDVNGFRPADRDRLSQTVGKTVASSIRAEATRYGRFASLEELLQRVPSAARLPADKLAALRALGSFGSGRASVNVASAEELNAAGLSKTLAKAVVSHREAHGDFESLDDLMAVPGMTRQALETARAKLAAEDVEAFFNSRAFGAPAGGTGYGAESSRRTTPAMGEDGKVAKSPANVVLGATDLFNRAKPGTEICVAMYGMSPGSREYKALVAAARRGAVVRVVLNDDYTENTVAALKSLKAQGLAVDVRVQKAKTMHEKFGVVGDDAFFGSANFSESSSTKHSEDRFTLKNSLEVAGDFRARFEEIWGRSK